MEKLLEFTLSQHLSSVNLIAAMGAIANIARQRPDYMSRVVQTFEALQGKCRFYRFRLFYVNVFQLIYHRH